MTIPEKCLKQLRMKKECECKMINDRWLVCGTRKKGYSKIVEIELDRLVEKNTDLEGNSLKPACIIEGCCPDSADVYAEEWAKKNKIILLHHPATEGGYLKRNIEMIGKCDMVVAFWDGYSYGTAHTISHAVKKNKRVVIIEI